MAKQPSGALTMAIQALHAAIAEEPDPGDVQTLSQCLAKMTAVQQGIMAPKGDSNSAAGDSTGYSGSPPAGPSTPADPRMFMAG